MRDIETWEVRLKLAATGAQYRTLSKTLFEFTKEAKTSRMSLKRFRSILERVVRPYESQQKSIGPRMSDAFTVFAYDGDVSKLPTNLQKAAQAIRHPPIGRPFRRADPAKADYLRTLLEDLLGWEHSRAGGTYLKRALLEVQKYLALQYRPIKTKRN